MKVKKVVEAGVVELRRVSEAGYRGIFLWRGLR
jgi:hypothetical protein